MKKRYIVIPAAMALLLGICASDIPMPAGFEKRQVFAVARDFVTKANDRSYDGCYALLGPVMQKTVTAQRLQEILEPVLASLGPFARFKGFSAAVLHADGQPYVQCIVKCQYENESADFTISIGRDMLISGLSIK